MDYGERVEIRGHSVRWLRREDFEPFFSHSLTTNWPGCDGRRIIIDIWSCPLPWIGGW